jgi:hypothetical protein
MKTNTIPPAPSNSIQTFTHDFGDGVRVTAKIAPAQIAALPVERLHRLIGFEWQGQPRNAHFPAYSAWLQNMWQHIADTARKSLVLVLRPPSGDPFAVHFLPGQPRLIIPLPRQ